MYLSVFLVSASNLAFEIILSRLFSIAQFYHFAFITVSLALLGMGASGTFLSTCPALRSVHPSLWLYLAALLTSLVTFGSFALANALPFDSFSIAWDRTQVFYLIAMYLALATPFFCAGLAVGGLLVLAPSQAPRIYGANLIGAAAGCPLALMALAILGGEGATLCSALLAALAAVAAILVPRSSVSKLGLRSGARVLGSLVGIGLTGLLGLWTVAPPPFVAIRLSPYKALSQTLRYPGSEWVWTKWDAGSRVDLIRSAGIRSFPGLSYAYLGALPQQEGLTFDGDDLSPVTVISSGEECDFARYMPASLAYSLRLGAHTLILGARGGLDVAVALANGASHVTAVESNAIAVETAQGDGFLGNDPRVQFVVEEPRSFVRRTAEHFDVVQLALVSPYRPVTSGTYSLIEDYGLTVEAIVDYLARLKDGGLFVVTRWLQTPPSEPLRMLALLITAAERSHLNPAQSLVVLRGYNTATFLAKRGPWTDEELVTVREFAATRKFDLALAPGLTAEEANRFNVLEEDVFFRTFRALLEAKDRLQFYRSYPFDVSPPTDDRPFFGHYFTIAQAGAVWAQLGKTWQPFGGAGFYLLLALLAFAVIMAGVLILLPLALGHRLATTAGLRWTFTYFAMLGLGFMFVEIPLIQRLILFVGRPVYALAIVLFALLTFSGLGSLVSARMPWHAVLFTLVGLIAVYPVASAALFDLTLGFSLAARFLVAIITLAPLGFLLGIPFPRGIDYIYRQPDLVPWAWGINSAASVVASVLAALVALSAGFSVVLMMGAVCYSVALVVSLTRR